jgi:UDP-glucose 4-epimerase
MKVLVVGGAGYIGSEVVYRLISQNNSVVVFDNLSTGHLAFIKGVPFIKGDITIRSDLDKAFKDNSFDCVMHFAAKIVVPDSVVDPLSYYKNNVEGVRVLLECIRDYKVKYFIFSSSAAVYGDNRDGVCYETSPTKPINPYGETKLICEKMIEYSSAAYGFKYLLFRYFNVAGAGDPNNRGHIKEPLSHIVPIITDTMLKNRKEFVIAGRDYETKDGTNIRDYVHVIDLAIAHVKGLVYLENGGKSDVFNLGSQDGYSVLEVVKKAYSISPFDYSYGPRRGGDPDTLIANSDKAKKILGFEIKYDLNDMIKSDYEFRKNLKTILDKDVS